MIMLIVIFAILSGHIADCHVELSFFLINDHMADHPPPLEWSLSWPDCPLPVTYTNGPVAAARQISLSSSSPPAQGWAAQYYWFTNLIIARPPIGPLAEVLWETSVCFKWRLCLKYWSNPFSSSFCRRRWLFLIFGSGVFNIERAVAASRASGCESSQTRLLMHRH